MTPFYQGITDFIFLEDAPEPADMIFIPGGNYREGAEYAASLYHRGFSPYIMPSGKYSITKGSFSFAEYETEFSFMRELLLQSGVPDSAILREEEATYTYQNAIFSRRNLERLGIPVKQAILCCQAFHGRRCLMYYQEQFPATRFLVCSAETRGIGRDTWYKTREGIDVVLGEVERCGSQFHEIMKQHLEK